MREGKVGVKVRVKVNVRVPGEEKE